GGGARRQEAILTHGTSPSCGAAPVEVRPNRARRRVAGFRVFQNKPAAGRASGPESRNGASGKGLRRLSLG
ncbi:MAG: hypothetical protein J2P46_13545, partial [Zavarzinella sp.]|nr:hypothetical protein [Zavarzinella sp.]